MPFIVTFTQRYLAGTTVHLGRVQHDRNALLVDVRRRLCNSLDRHRVLACVYMGEGLC